MQNSPKNQEQSSDSLYLSQLEFTPEDNKSLLKYFLDNFRVVILLIISILLWGAFSFRMLPLESNPEVKIPFGVVSVTLPGASPSDIEELIVKKIENKISNLQGVRQISSTAFNSFASISVEFRAEENMNESIRRLRDAVEKVKTELPADATDPVVGEVSFSNTPVWTFVLAGPYDDFSLRKYAEKVKDELEKLSGTSEVLISGGDQTEIEISFIPAKLEFYQLSPDQIIGQIKSNNQSFPLGTIDVSNFQYSIRTQSKIISAQQLRNTPISTGSGQFISLSDLANVTSRAAERKVINRFSLEGQPSQNAVTVNVVKKTGSSIVELVDQGKVKLEELKKSEFPEHLEVDTILDISERIRDDFDDLVRDAFITIFLVFSVLLLFVGLKEALVAGLVIPLVFAATFGFMVIFDVTLNFLSLFSLIMSLGFLVDDAIVVVQATKKYLSTGKFTPEEAILLVFKDFRTLLITTSLTTIFSFIPLLLATGIIGQFIRSIPITVSMTIFSSTLIAIFINHTMGAALERFRLTPGWYKSFMFLLGLILLFSLITLLSAPNIFSLILTIFLATLLFTAILKYRSGLREKLENNLHLQYLERNNPELIKERIRHHYLIPQDQKTLWQKINTGILNMDAILPYYDRVLRGLLDSKVKRFLTLFLALILFLTSFALPATGILKSEFLSPSDQNIMYVNITGSPGLLLSETEKTAKQVEEILLNEKDIRSFSVVVGSQGVNLSGGGASSGGANQSSQTNRAQFAINLFELEERPSGLKSYDVATKLREKLVKIPGPKVELVELRGGPPSGADFEAEFSGENLAQLESAVNKYKEILAAIPGTVNEKSSLNLSPGEFTFNFIPAELKSRGLSAAAVSAQLRTAISSIEVTRLIEDEDEIIIRARFAPESVNSLEKIKNLTFFSPSGSAYKLSDIAKLEIGSSFVTIGRVDQKRVISLSAAVEKPYLPNEILAEFQKQLESNPLPENIQVSFGGQNETNAESVLSILRAMIVAFVLIVSTLVIQFNSFRKAALVLITIPLAITGVFWGFTIARFTLTFPSLIGILALFGIVVKNAIIVVDKINLNLKVGISFEEAIIDASKSRLEAIFLTSIATIIGMLPITLTNETWSGLGAALIFGLSTSTILTLVVLPTAFFLLFKKSAEQDEKYKPL